MVQITSCPVCLNKWAKDFRIQPANFDGLQVSCAACGNYKVSGSAIEDFLRRDTDQIGDRRRAMISHRIRVRQGDARVPLLTTDWIEEATDNPVFPTPGQQATNAIRYIGDSVNLSGVAIETLPVHFYATIGSRNPQFAFEVTEELVHAGLVKGREHSAMGVISTFHDLA